ncbi:MAG: polyphosphate kinase 2 [Magnetococcus sp. DMHC-1]|nr:polyphosphate kinase 2 [Magnetococcales bacterium]
MIPDSPPPPAANVNPSPPPADPSLATREELLTLVQHQSREMELLKNEVKRLRENTSRAVQERIQEDDLKPYQAELIKMQHHLEVKEMRMIVILEGRDGAGKGGTLRRITRYMNEKHYRVVALGKPTDVQRTQWFFQRYVEQFPSGGEVVFFDRSWYNRAMVEPVFKFCTERQYQDFMLAVTGFEQDIVRQGTILVKTYFSVSKEVQQARFDRRRNDPLRNWKLSEVDLQAQDHWDDFTNMKYFMLKRTHTQEAPWTLIRSDNKHKARLNAMKVVLNAVPYPDRNPDLDYVPDPEVVVSGQQELELMDAQRIQEGKFTL